MYLKKRAICCLFFLAPHRVMSGLGNLSDIQFVVTLERLSAVSGESLQSPHLPHPMSPARNKAAIVNSPNFTAACRNPVLLFSFSSTSTLCWDQSGLSRPQKPEALASSSFSTEFDTPQLPAIQAPAPCNLFPFVKQQYPSQKKMLAQQSLWKTLSPQPKMALRLLIYWPVTKQPLTIYTTSVVVDTCYIIFLSTDSETSLTE